MIVYLSVIVYLVMGNPAHRSYCLIGVANGSDLCVISWNVRDLNDSAHKEQVRETIVCAKPAIVCLQETELSSMNMTILMETVSPRLSSYCALDVVGTRGGILFACDKDIVSVANIECKLFTVMAMVTLLSTNTNFRLTTFYGPAHDQLKEEL